MENYDILASLNVKAATPSTKREIVISPSTPDTDNKSSISAIVALRQSHRDSLTSGTRRASRQASRNQLIGILTENNGSRKSSTGARKKTVCIEPKLHRSGIVGNVVKVEFQRSGSVSSAIGNTEILAGNGQGCGKQKIPRPANAFMLFANEWRKKLAIENPRESNKDISVRLGVLWKNMDKDIKEKYFALAREVDAEHKRKYPDYVYNPKEARLRKAMREQSRELSRQTILQTAIAASTTGSASAASCPANTSNISSSSVTGTTNFLNHPLTCPGGSSAANVSSLPGSPSFNTGNRIINPWFPASHGPSTNHLKPVLSPRVMTVAQHQQQQQQQHRTFDKSKEVLRKQAECTGVGAFSAVSNPGYPTDFSGHGNPPTLSAHQSSNHESNEYCVIAEFSDGQKWHPYQNGPSPYHSRSAGTHQKMGALHPGMQSTNPHAHPGWNQFCAVPLSNVNRAPRHMLFLQEQQNQHCAFPEEMQIPYMQSKHVDISHRLHPSYSQQKHQQPKLQASSMSPLNMSQLREPEKSSIEDAPRWEANGSSVDGGIGASVRGRRENDLDIHQDQADHEQTRSYQESRQHPKNQQQRYESPSPSEKHKKPSCSKPLPGFHQAFGSTEIGRFSRSEFFAHMVGEGSNNVSNSSQNSASGLGDREIENSVSDLEDSSSSSNIAESAMTRVSSSSPASSRNRTNRREASIDDSNSQGSGSNENSSNLAVENNEITSFNNSVPIEGNYYNETRSPGPSGTGSAIVGVTTMPRWHSPYVSAIGSEI